MLYILSILSVVVVMVNVGRLEGCTCSKLAGTKYHFWIENSSLNRHIRVVNPQVFVSGYQRSIFSQYWFATTFYSCPGSSGVYAVTRVGSRYLANMVSTNQALDLVNNAGSSFCYNDTVMFKYDEAGGEEIGTLRSFPTGRFLDRVNSDGSLVLTHRANIWLSWPAVIADLVFRSALSTGITAGMGSNRSFGRFSVAGPTRGNTPMIRRMTSGQAPFQFEVIPYRLCKRFDSYGRIVQGMAIVLRSTPQRYIAVSITDDGDIPLPFGPGNQGRNSTAGQTTSPVPYNIVDLRSYGNRGASSRSSYIYKADIRDQRVIDERFFEVLKQTDGTYRLLSTLHPDRYLAMFDNEGVLDLVVAPLSSNPSSVINYNFIMTIPELSRRLGCQVPRQPTPPTCHRPYYSCHRRPSHQRQRGPRRNSYSYRY